MNNFGGLRQALQGRQGQGGQGAMGQAINKILQARQQGMQQMPQIQQGMPQMPGVGIPQQAGNPLAEFMQRMKAQQQAQQVIPMQQPGFGGDIAGVMQRAQQQRMQQQGIPQMLGMQQGGQDNTRLKLLQMLMAMKQRAG